MNRWKTSFILCFTLLILTIFLAGYLLLDGGISSSYRQVSLDDQIEANKVLGKLVVNGSPEYSQKDFLYLLRMSFPAELIVEEGNIMSLGSNKFKFENDRLVSAQ